MASYEILLSATDKDGMMVLLHENCSHFRATTVSIDQVRKTVLKNCSLIIGNHGETVHHLTANIYEVTDKGDRVYIGKMFQHDAPSVKLEAASGATADCCGGEWYEKSEADEVIQNLTSEVARLTDALKEATGK